MKVVGTPCLRFKSLRPHGLLLILTAINIASSLAKPLVNGSESSGQGSNSISSSSHNQEQSVVLYANVNFRGDSAEMRLNQSSCANLPGILNDIHSSVDAKGGCVILCEHRHCRGRCQAVEYYSSDLSRLELNDKVSSVKMCG